MSASKFSLSIKYLLLIDINFRQISLSLYTLMFPSICPSYPFLFVPLKFQIPTTFTALPTSLTDIREPSLKPIPDQAPLNAFQTAKS